MRFRNFLILYIALVTTPMVLLVLCSIGMALEIVRLFLTTLLSILIMVLGLIVASKLSAKVTKAKPEELLREDDVLLEAVAFSQSILFVLLSLMQSEDELRRALLYGVVITTIFFIR